MGKGNRVRTERADERKAKKEAAVRAQAKAKLWHNIFTCILVVLIAALVVGVVYAAFIKGPLADRNLHNSVVLKSDNYQVDGAQMSYFFNSSYIQWLNYYGSYASMFGLNTSLPLKDQTYGDGTWYDYMAEQAEETARQYMVLCEEANKRGIKLDDDDMAKVDSAMESLRADAESAKLSYSDFITKYYGKYVKEADIRAAYELRQLASKVYNTVYDEFEFSDDDITKQCADNIANYYKSDYKSIEITADVESDADDDAVKAANDKSKEEADKFAAITDADEFDKAAEEYFRSLATVVEDDDENAKKDGYMTESDLKKKLESVTTTGSAYSTTGDYAKWAYEKDGDEYVRKAGDTTIVEKKDDKTGVITYTVYQLVKPIYRDEYLTKNVRHILITVDSYDSDKGLSDEDAKKKAEDILAEYNSGSKTEDAFAELAGKYTMDTGSKDKGGLYENAVKGETVEEFNDWIYDEKRNAGDVEIVKTTFGYHIMYFIGDGTEAWKVSAESDLRSAEYQKAYEKMVENYSITTDDNAMQKLSICDLT